MPVLEHGFSLGLVPNLLKRGFISSGRLYLGEGEEEEPPQHLEGPALLINQDFFSHFGLAVTKEAGGN